jgi:hypothetical protein
MQMQASEEAATELSGLSLGSWRKNLSSIGVTTNKNHILRGGWPHCKSEIALAPRDPTLPRPIHNSPGSRTHH